MSDEAVTKQIEGTCEEISEKNGWTSFAISVEGNTYPVRLSTKLPALIEQGRAVGQQRAVWTFKESQGGENPNKPGTYYTNRYFESVEIGGEITHNTGHGTDGPAPSPSRNAGGSRTGATDRSIERQVILKEMVQHYPGLDGLDVAGWWDLMGRLDTFMVNGPAVNAQGATADDIPF